MPLSDIKIRNLKPREKAYKVSDFEGLFVLVKVSGSKSWRFKYRIDGKERLLVIGDYPAVTLAKARQARDIAKAQLADGIDPSEAKQEEKRIRLEAKGQTFEKIGAAFLAKQRKEGKSAATLSKTEYHLKLANSDFVQVGIINGKTFTGIAQIISGLMAREYYRLEKKFGRTAGELNSLLMLSSELRVSPLTNDLDLGYDVDLFYGIRVAEKYDLGDGYFIAPFDEFRDYIDPSWFKDRAPDQVKARDLELFFGIAAPFRWKPEFHQVNARLRDRRPKDVPLLFHRVAAEFAELLSVVLECPITWVYDFPCVVSKTSLQLLGQHYGSGSARAGEFVGNFHDPFRKQSPASPDRVRHAVELFSKKSTTNYATVAPLIHRLAEAQRTFGRFAKEDRILDLAIIFERYFPKEKTYKKELSRNVSSLLGASNEENVQIGEDIDSFYRTRNAIVHGGKNKGDAELLKEIDQALENGFKYARALLLHSIS
ncbi:hypothetical protein DS901_11575 [Loktanella sp. D2R18]|uniref:integrase arm-type DNA-binding domain-containing protein n=1 Tax=Rhodobacterales TaxID=204455 RepID=UPI000DE98EA4|nr:MULTISPECIES: integrase arm-type DNA-binding domain-containing protein [Rhodobacterales]RBW42881.1 hypothetical protein DS901_11575 [Loktanella sp. D2R18]